MSERIRYGNVIERTGAGVIDELVVIAGLLIVFLITGEFTATSFAISTAVIWLVMARIEGRYGGTPGKLLFGLCVTLADGTTTPIGFRLALSRRVPDAVSFVPGIGQLIAVLIALASIVMISRDKDERRSPYDLFTNTRVVVHKAGRS